VVAAGRGHFWCRTPDPDCKLEEDRNPSSTIERSSEDEQDGRPAMREARYPEVASRATRPTTITVAASIPM
jgi:hypothetical protein